MLHRGNTRLREPMGYTTFFVLSYYRVEKWKPLGARLSFICLTEHNLVGERTAPQPQFWLVSNKVFWLRPFRALLKQCASEHEKIKDMFVHQKYHRNHQDSSKHLRQNLWKICGTFVYSKPDLNRRKYYPPPPWTWICTWHAKHGRTWCYKMS